MVLEAHVFAYINNNVLLSNFVCFVFRMEKERGFNFQLLIPSKVNNCQAVRPQENLENCNGFINTLQKVSYMTW